ALFFIAGLATAIIFSVQTNIQTKSSAKSTRAEELEQIKKAIKDKGAKWEAADNPIFQLSDEERRKRVGAKNPSQEQIAQNTLPESALAGITPPASFNWRNNGGNFVTPVKNQGNCASCWAFSTTAGLESYTLIKNNQPNTSLDLSEQTLVSCSGAGSCTGGGPDGASTYITNEGLPQESCLPYTATNGTCSNNCTSSQASTYKIGSWSYLGISKPPIDSIKQALINYGPLPTTMSIYSDFYSYRSGIYKYTSGTYQGGHAVLIVGYDDPGQYFIAKNSWGTGWGEAGFFKISYNDGAGFGYYTMIYHSPPEVSSLVLSSPNGSESWPADSTKTIAWDYSGDSSAKVRIELLRNGIVESVIAAAAPIGTGGKGSYSWTIPATKNIASDYKIKITANSETPVSDLSNGNFSIVPPIPPAIVVVSPNGGEIWGTGSTQSVKWNYAGNPGSTAKIELLKGGALVQIITSAASVSSGAFNWKVPNGLSAGSDYQIRVTSASNSSYSDTSNNNFSIAKISKGGRK
ncbi:MAG: C1 family peptidase, partial [Candidatus Moraniibacteriota bacterium]